METKLRIVPSEATEQMAGYGCRELIDGEMIWVKLGDANLNANLFRAAWPGMLSATPKLTREQVDELCIIWSGGIAEWAKDEQGRWLHPDRESERDDLRRQVIRFLSAAFGAEVEG